MTKEIWKQIKGYEGHYEVSNHGRVKSIERTIRGHKLVEKIMLPANDFNGYLSIRFRNGKQKRFLIHRLVANIFLSNPENLPIVNHKDRDKTNNNLSNLEWVTVKENDAHWRRTPLPKSVKMSVKDFENESMVAHALAAF